MTMRRAAPGRTTPLADLLRFVGAGGVNTLFTVVLYQGLLFALSPTMAYTAAWVAGLAFVMIVYPSRVFVGGRADGRARLGTGIIYLASFALGLVVVRIVGERLDQPQLAVFAALAVTTVFNFLVMRLFLRK